ncbi:hypothetical protein PT2222_40321 [Paraburkholderia tropica]
MCRSNVQRQTRDTAHVRTQRFRHGDRAIGFLIVLQHRDQRAAHREARTIERVHEFRLALRVAIARLHAARLERFRVRAARNFAIRVLRRQPDFEVVRLGRRETHVARAQRDHAIRQAKLLQDGFRVHDHLLQRVIRRFRRDDLDHFDLVELMLTDHAARVAAIRAGFRAEARRMRGQLDRQRAAFDDALAHRIRERNLRRGDQILRDGVFRAALFHAEHVVRELRKLTRAVQDFRIDDVGRVRFRVAVLRRVRVDHELRKRAVQTRDLAAQHREARARELRARFEVETERRADVDVILHLEVERARRAPAAHFHVAAFVAAHGHALVRQVRHAEQQIRELRLDLVELDLRRLHLVADAAHFGHHGRGVLAAALHRADLLRQAVAARLHFFGAGLNGTAFRFERGKGRDVEGVAAVGEALRDAVEVFAQQLDVEHGIVRRSFVV